MPNKQIGDTFTLVRTCDRYRPLYYAAASGDFNPIHIDQKVGEEAGLGGTILQGLCTLGWAVDAFVHYLKDPGAVRSIKVRFSRPVAIDDVVTYQGKVTAIEGGLITAELEATNQRGEAVLKGAEVTASIGTVTPRSSDTEPGRPPREWKGTGINPAVIGKKYGPFFYEAGLEKMREFSYAVGGGVPSTGFSGKGAPDGLHPWYFDEKAAKDSPHGAVIAMPNFCVAWAITPFARACMDPELKLNVLRLVHGEQQFEFGEVVRSGDRLTTHGTISNVESKRSLDFLEVTTETHNQHGKLVVKGVWTAIIRG